jgi:hypothetical protein
MNDEVGVQVIEPHRVCAGAIAILIYIAFLPEATDLYLAAFAAGDTSYVHVV